MRSCFECGDPALEDHHVVPQSRGGTKTVSLCPVCHGKVHGVERMDISRLTREAMDRKRKSGLRYCNAVTPPDVVKRLVDMRNDGYTYQRICDTFNAEGTKTVKGRVWTVSSVQSVLKYVKRRSLYEYR